jgi:hypothetical protein
LVYADFGLFRVRIKQVSQYKHMDKTLKIHYKPNQQMYENVCKQTQKTKDDQYGHDNIIITVNLCDPER